VLLAAGFVALMKTNVPDALVGAGIAGLFLVSAFSLLKSSLYQMAEVKGQDRAYGS